MTDIFSIARASLRMARAAWGVDMPSGAKLVLLCIIQHYNDARGVAFPSLARLARLCGLHKRTVQGHIALLVTRGVLQVDKCPGLSTNVYRIHEAALAPPPSATHIFPPQEMENLPPKVVLAAPRSGDFSGQRAEITTQNGSNEPQQKKTTEPPATPCPAPPPAAPMPQEPSSSTLFLQSLQSPADQAALQAWQQVRRAKGRPALPNALQCQQLLHHAATLGQPMGWVVQVMVLNDWASFDPAWLHNQRPPPRLPTVVEAPPRPDAPPPPALRPKAAEAPPAVTAEQVAQAKARMAELLKQWRGPEPAYAPITPCGVPWADQIIASAVRGEPVSHAALHCACAAAKVPVQAVRAAAIKKPALEGG